MPRNYGLLEKTPDDRDFLLDAFAPKVLSLPKDDHWGHGKTYAAWGMNGNGPLLDGEELPKSWHAAKNGAGDCVEAAWVNELKVLLTDSGMDPVATAALVGNAHTALTLYKDITGYDPHTGQNDNGTEIRERLKYAQKVGLRTLGGTVHKIGPYVAVDPQKLDHLLFAMYYFDAVPLGLSVTRANEEAFANAELNGETPIWDYDVGSPVEGLHCIPAVGRPDPTHIACPNWNLRTLLTEEFREEQVTEAWAYISPDRISKVTGKSYVGASEAVLDEYLTLVTK